MTGMRERMLLKLKQTKPHDGCGCEWDDKEYAAAIDAIMSEMETPSEGVVDAGEAAVECRSDLYNACCAMIRAIRDGK